MPIAPQRRQRSISGATLQPISNPKVSRLGSIILAGYAPIWGGRTAISRCRNAPWG
ncbi:hypothetical protein LC038_03865 [Epibacterium mobile]|nr:hypothetical protein [Tritonibacter mobilis]